MEQIKNMVRECFRYKLSGISMVSCFVVSMLAVHYGISIYNNILKEHLEKNHYQYTYELNMNATARTFDDIPRLPESAKCNMKIRWVMVHDDMEDVTKIIDIIVSSHEEKWPLVSGCYATKEMLENREKIILIGQDRVQDTYKKGNDMYYGISGEEYRVIGVVGSEKSSIFDGCIILYMDCLGSQVEKCITGSGQGLNITLESDTRDVNEVYDQYIKGNYSMAKSDVSNEQGAYLSTAAPSYNEKEYCMIIYLFSLVCLSFVIKFWLVQRTHEMKICRAFGFSNRKIILRLLYSITSMFLVSMAIFLVIVFVLQILMRNLIVEYRLFFSIKYITLYILIYILSILIISAKSVYGFIEKSIVENL
ncbi:MAG: hypothetical protein K2J90_10885 [Lachnospiraceae bacterium]|nr:hypothetical protein [Lachnospiraceae bacterium]